MEIKNNTKVSIFAMKSDQDVKTNNLNKIKTMFKVIKNDFDGNRSLLKNEIYLKKNKFLKLKRNFINRKLVGDSFRKLTRKGTNFSNGRWTKEEHQKFIEALLKYGNHWKKVQDHIGTRNSTQARSHAQKFFVKIGKTQIQKLDLDFENNSLRSLSLLMNKLNGDMMATSLRSLNEIVLCKKKEKKCFVQMDHHSSTESDSINFKMNHERNLKNTKHLKQKYILNNFVPTCNEAIFILDDGDILNPNTSDYNKNFYCDESLPESPSIFSNFLSNSNSEGVSSEKLISYNNSLNDLNDLSNSYLYKFHKDNTVFNKSDFEFKPKYEEEYFKTFFEDRNYFDREQFKLELPEENYYSKEETLRKHRENIYQIEANQETFFFNI